ncbi:MAG: hypothetical protein HC866_18610 [Leptolyngbyaceae cyanobacterium RU_5_1]|nr:hypothetical protein [Leptolyngbyaceae cyanobacterium RU_5_1]
MKKIATSLGFAIASLALSTSALADGVSVPGFRSGDQIYLEPQNRPAPAISVPGNTLPTDGTITIYSTQPRSYSPYPAPIYGTSIYPSAPTQVLPRSSRTVIVYPPIYTNPIYSYPKYPHGNYSRSGYSYSNYSFSVYGYPYPYNVYKHPRYAHPRRHRL